MSKKQMVHVHGDKYSALLYGFYIDKSIYDVNIHYDNVEQNQTNTTIFMTNQNQLAHIAKKELKKTKIFFESNGEICPIDRVDDLMNFGDALKFTINKNIPIINFFNYDETTKSILNAYKFIATQLDISVQSEINHCDIMNFFNETLSICTINNTQLNDLFNRIEMTLANVPGVIIEENLLFNSHLKNCVVTTNQLKNLGNSYHKSFTIMCTNLNDFYVSEIEENDAIIVVLLVENNILLMFVTKCGEKLFSIDVVANEQISIGDLKLNLKYFTRPEYIVSIV